MAGGSLAGYLARRLGLLALTLVLVPSLSFVAFTLLRGDAGGPGGVLSALAEYLRATFLQADLGADRFQGATFRRTREVVEVIRDGDRGARPVARRCTRPRDAHRFRGHSRRSPAPDAI